MSARFWVWWKDAWVKITVPVGECVSLHQGGHTDEGYYRIQHSYWNDGSEVTFYYYRGERDCDGRMDYDRKYCCTVEDLSKIDMNEGVPYPGNEGIFAPLWRETLTRQRDYAAEAMGY